MPKQPFVPVPGVLRVRFSGLHVTRPWVNGFAIQYTGSAPDNAALSQLALTLGQTWTTTFGTILMTITSVRLVQVWDISSDTGSEGSDATTHAGLTTATSPLPVQSAICISWPVNRRWRGGHFRSYVPARTVADITNGSTLSGTTQSQYQVQATAFLDDINASSVPYGPLRLGGVRYFPTGTDPDGTPTVKTSGEFHAFADPTVHTRLDSQRRRSGKEIV